MRCALLSALLFIFMLAPAHSEGGSARCMTCARNAQGRIKRNPEARRAFQKSNPCPSTGKRSGGCSGYVVDHVKPLKRGGADMQWQTKADAKAKDRIE